MTYLSLARKYRPQKFRDLVGQDAVVKSLTKAIELGREPHGVILTGVRGIGKTTVARLYAKALNCEKPLVGDPCDQCASCLAINQGIHEDVLEIDGASHTSVDDVRALKETVGYSTQRSKFKVYIIDEVHMLSQSAFNALLKTLEEPPPHVVFVFATTELQKVPQTIVSRCQTFFLKKFSQTEIAQRIAEILKLENISFAAESLPAIAKAGQGSMRDALTILDQVLAFAGGEVTMASVQQFIDHVGVESCLALTEAMVDRNIEDALKVVSGWDQAGFEFVTALEDASLMVRNAFILKDLGEAHLNLESLGLSGDHLQQLSRIAGKAEPFDLNRIFRTLVKCRQDLDGSNLDRYVLENFLLEWCFDPGLPLEMAAPLASPTKAAPTPSIVAPPPVEKAHLSQRFDFESVKKADPAPPTAAPAKESSPETPDQAEKKTFPLTWQDCVNAFKTIEPLYARSLEELHVLTYSPTLIEIHTKAGSLSAQDFLSKGGKDTFLKKLNEQWGFHGELRIAEGQAGQSQQTPSLLEVKKTAKEARQAAVRQEAMEAPLTREVLSAFGGKIDEITVSE